MGVRREKKEGARSIPQTPRTQSAFMKSISTYTWQRAHMHGTKRAHQCHDPTPPHRTSHRTSPPSTNSHARSPDMEQHGSLDGDPCPIYARQASNRYLITCTRLFRSASYSRGSSPVACCSYWFYLSGFSRCAAFVVVTGMLQRFGCWRATVDTPRTRASTQACAS